jgi:hypothetical protein
MQGEACNFLRFSLYVETYPSLKHKEKLAKAWRNGTDCCSLSSCERCVRISPQDMITNAFLRFALLPFVCVEKFFPDSKHLTRTAFLSLFLSLFPPFVSFTKQLCKWNVPWRPTSRECFLFSYPPLLLHASVALDKLRSRFEVWMFLKMRRYNT